MDPELLEAMPDTITLYRKGDPDAAGNDTWSETGEDIRANVAVQLRDGQPSLSEGMSGHRAPFVGTIIFPTANVVPGDKIVVLGHTAFVGDVETFRDPEGPADYVQQITFDEES